MDKSRFFTDEFLIQACVVAWGENPIVGARLLLDVQKKRGSELAERCYSAVEAHVFALMPAKKRQSGSSDC